MKIASIEPTIVSVPNTHRETSSRIQRDGVTAVVVKLTTDEGLVGWGESCPGSNVESVCEVIKSVDPIFRGRDPWQREALPADFWGPAHWYNREMAGNFAFAGIDMALWHLCGKACDQPVYNLLGGLRRREMAGDVLRETLPIATSPKWGVPEGTGLCVTVDEGLVVKYHSVYEARGQYLPYQVDAFPAL
jgi:L-alanine-DL-glutamate epimerase-like enolase superfamily enzyme